MSSINSIYTCRCVWIRTYFCIFINIHAFKRRIFNSTFFIEQYLLKSINYLNSTRSRINYNIIRIKVLIQLTNTNSLKGCITNLIWFNIRILSTITLFYLNFIIIRKICWWFWNTTYTCINWIIILRSCHKCDIIWYYTHLVIYFGNCIFVSLIILIIQCISRIKNMFGNLSIHQHRICKIRRHRIFYT